MDKLNCAEDRRTIRWTSFKNLDLWFNSWETFLVKFGFTNHNANGELVFEDGALCRILNMDESCTCISLDGRDGNWGGRPAVTYYDERFTDHISSTATERSWSYSCSVYYQAFVAMRRCGCNAAHNAGCSMSRAILKARLVIPYCPGGHQGAMQNNNDEQNTSTLLAILMAIAMQWYVTACKAQWCHRPWYWRDRYPS